MSYPFIIQGNNVTVVINNKPHTVSKTHITYQKIVDAIKADDWETVIDVIEPKKVVINYGRGHVSVQGEQLFWKGQPFANALATRMVQMLQEGFSVEPMVSFMENLMQNPSRQAVSELYGFLEKNNLPITPDGHFLAYKRVREDFTDCHTGTMDNSVGQVVEMERNMVDDNRNNTCSAGLHFCSHSYLSNFGGQRTVIVKINPRDVVSIPSDYNDAKGRACRYEVIGEVGRDPKDEVEFTRSVQSNAQSVKSTPKTGSTPFYRGYTDGYNVSDYNSMQYRSPIDRKNYDEGYAKGEDDQDSNARYQYVPPITGDWPA